MTTDRRRFLKGAGLAAAAAGVPLPAPALPDLPDLDVGRLCGRYQWLVGDHHTHSQYSYDAMYRIDDIARGGRAHGADWIVFTDHGHAEHEKVSVEPTEADFLAARRKYPDLLLWHGLEWNVPGAEHATVFFQAGADQAAKLREFERAFDWRLTNSEASSPANEALALRALRWLSDEERARRIHAPVVLINHPLRNGRVAPHELRAYRDAAPGIVIGMEGAPGAQADGFPKPLGNGGARGGYINTAGPNSWPDYPAEAYRTHGGWDWATAKVGGLWDSLLAEGKPWWITTNSDSHYNRGDTLVRPDVPGDWYDTHGKFPDPVDAGTPQLAAPYADFYPGEFSRTYVGVTRRSLEGVLAGLRAGRIWGSHGGLVQELEVGAYSGGSAATLGGRLRVRRGSDVTVVVRARLAARPNGGGSVPRLARLDVIAGPVTGPVADRDTMTAPGTRVVESFEPRWGPGRQVVFRHTFRNVREPFYFRVRGSNGDAEPTPDVVGQADPFDDLWLYANPLFADIC
ncbi:twin-arginine translocation signal domain-containing protein [Amycolatopsis sp.]|uniref:twin-arginine translocation signal domain-containing protein n=1 Tax=Amycolatopsis sp. TaxID=37632 RepID=UPI002D7E1A67|nr:PHP domain-containing protein [Amycolatopsis sp.]HET6705636.1 PHP domain-containing protein [Amycolatopsis sp.]